MTRDRDFLFIDDDPFADDAPDAYTEGWEMPGDRQHDNPIACPPDCYVAKDYTTADPNIGAVDSCSAHRPKTLDDLRAAVERAR